MMAEEGSEMPFGSAFGKGQKTTLSASKALSNLSIPLPAKQDPSANQLCHLSRKASSSSPQRLRTNSRSRITTWEERTCKSWSSVMDPRTKVVRSDLICSARERMDLMLSMRN